MVVPAARNLHWRYGVLHSAFMVCKQKGNAWGEPDPKPARVGRGYKTYLAENIGQFSGHEWAKEAAERKSRYVIFRR